MVQGRLLLCKYYVFDNLSLLTCKLFLPSVTPCSRYVREWTDDGKLWVQYVSSTPATRLDVTNLQEQLDQKLQQRQARETGICPVREELYSQCFGMSTAVGMVKEATTRFAQPRIKDDSYSIHPGFL